MCRFVQCYFGEALIVALERCLGAIIIMAKPVSRDHGNPAAHFGFTENIGQNGDAQIDIGHSNDSQVACTRNLRQMLEDETCFVLFAVFHKSVRRQLPRFKDVYGNSQNRLQVGGNDAYRDFTHGAHLNEPKVRAGL